MEVKKYSKQNLYQVKANFSPTQNVLDDLTYFYLPLIEIEGFSFYLFLLRELQNSELVNKFLSSERISKYLNISSEKILFAINNLEKFGLLEIYFNESEVNKLVYLLKQPLTFNDQNFVPFFNLLKLKIGRSNNLLSTKSLQKLKFDYDDFKVITNKIKLKNSSQIGNNAFEIDLTNLFNLLDSKKINYHRFWNKEIENFVKNLIITNNLNFLEIVRIFDYIYKNKFEFTAKTLLNAFNNLKIDVALKKASLWNKDDVLQSFEPNRFLQTSLSRSLTTTEEKFIDKLKKYEFENGIINLLLDYSLIINNNIIVIGYVDKIAKSLLKENIKTFSQVKEHLKNAYQIKNNLNNSNKVKIDKNQKFKINQGHNISELKVTKDESFWGDL